jgi:L-lactate dehydrogenase complex protein LldG
VSSRNTILEAVRRNRAPQTPLPDLPAYTEPATNLVERFKEITRVAGGRTIEISAGEDVAQAVASAYPDQKVLCSTVLELVPGTLQPQEIQDPHDLAGVDLFVCRGAFGVAEEGAIWLGEEHMAHRAAPFLAQHLCIVLDRNTIVRNMHEAYARLSVAESGFGVFIAGPSKTADIEQSLVIGAHGPRSHTVILL